MIDFRVQILVFIALLYFANRLIGGALEKLGLKESKEDREQQKTIEKGETSNAWQPNYYKEMIEKNGRNKTALSLPATVEGYAKIFRDAKGLVNDDEEAVYGALRSMKYKTQLSQVAERFFQMYKQDLYLFLKSFLSDDELEQVAKLVNNLKSGKV